MRGKLSLLVLILVLCSLPVEAGLMQDFKDLLGIGTDIEVGETIIEGKSVLSDEWASLEVVPSVATSISTIRNFSQTLNVCNKDTDEGYFFLDYYFSNALMGYSMARVDVWTKNETLIVPDPECVEIGDVSKGTNETVCTSVKTREASHLLSGETKTVLDSPEKKSWGGQNHYVNPKGEFYLGGECKQYLLNYKTTPSDYTGKWNFRVWGNSEDDWSCIEKDNCFFDYILDPSYSSAFTYKMPLNITNNDRDINNYTVDIVFNTTNFNYTEVQSDWNDTIFVNFDETAQIPCYRWNYTASTNATFSCLITNFTNDYATQLWVYYKNSSAGMVNQNPECNNGFLLCDTMNTSTGAINTTIWNDYVGATWSANSTGYSTTTTGGEICQLPGDGTAFMAICTLLANTTGVLKQSQQVETKLVSGSEATTSACGPSVMIGNSSNSDALGASWNMTWLFYDNGFTHRVTQNSTSLASAVTAIRIAIDTGTVLRWIKADITGTSRTGMFMANLSPSFDIHQTFGLTTLNVNGSTTPVGYLNNSNKFALYNTDGSGASACGSATTNKQLWYGVIYRSFLNVTPSFSYGNQSANGNLTPGTMVVNNETWNTGSSGEVLETGLINFTINVSIDQNFYNNISNVNFSYNGQLIARDNQITNVTVTGNWTSFNVSLRTPLVTTNASSMGFNWTFGEQGNATVAIANSTNRTQVVRWAYYVNNMTYRSPITSLSPNNILVNFTKHVDLCGVSGLEINVTNQWNQTNRTTTQLLFNASSYFSTGLAVKQGNYTGDGVDDRQIGNIGFTPKVVFIVSTNKKVFRIDSMPAGNNMFVAEDTMYGKVFQTDGIKSFNICGFVIGTNNTVNKVGDTYYYLALGGDSTNIATGSYVPDDTDGRVISFGSGFTPMFVTLKSNQTGGVSAHLKISGMLDKTYNANGAGLSSDEIVSLGNGTFTVDEDANVVSVPASIYYYFVMNSSDKLYNGSFVGTGAPTDIATAPFTPQAMFLTNAFVTDTMGGDVYRWHVGSPTAGEINFIANGFHTEETISSTDGGYYLLLQELPPANGYEEWNVTFTTPLVYVQTSINTKGWLNITYNGSMVLRDPTFVQIVNPFANQSYDSPIFETSLANFTLNVSNTSAIVNVNFTWNASQFNTSQITNVTSGTGAIFNITIRLPLIPSNQSNYTFQWNATLSNGTVFNSNLTNQTVLLTYYPNNIYKNSSEIEGGSQNQIVNITKHLFANGISEAVNLEYNQTNYSASIYLNSTNYEDWSASFITPFVNLDTIVQERGWLNISQTMSSIENDNYLRNTTNNFTQTITNINISGGACSVLAGYVVIANFTFFNELGNQSIKQNGSDQISVWSTIQSLNQTAGFNFVNTNFTEICIACTNCNLTANFNVQYSDNETVYTLREYWQRLYNFNTTFNNTLNISLYNLQLANATEIVFNVLDNNDDPIQNMIVQALKYNISNNSYKIVDTEITDFDGKARLRLFVADDYYKIRLIDGNNTVVLETTLFKLLFTEYFIRVVPVSTDITTVIKLQEIPHNLTFDNGTKIITLSWNDIEHITSNNCLEIVNTTNASGLIINKQCSTNQSGYLTFNVTNINGTYIAKYVVGDNSFLIDAISVILTPFRNLGREGIWMAFIIIGTLAAIGLSIDPTVSIIFTLLGVVMMTFTGMLPISWLTMSGLVVAGIITALVINKVQ